MAELSRGLDARLHWRQGALALDLDLSLPAQGITALFGPSGAGKTSCLRALAGLARDATGRVSFGDTLWQDSARGVFVPPERRRIGFVFQEPGLFEHLSVEGNLDYGYRRASRPAQLDREGLIDRFGLRALLARRVVGLSGGERQRVAMVRALLRDPALLLFDEPLSALDAGARGALLACLESLHANLRVPMVYVSHNVDEVARLADHLVLLDSGHVVAQGGLQDTLTRLDLPPALAEAMGAVIEGEVVACDAHDQLIELAFAGGRLWLPYRDESVGQRVRCRIAARDVVLASSPSTDSSALNQLRCRVVAMADAPLASQCLVQLDANGCLLLARITRRSWHAMGLSPGSAVWAQVKAVALGG